MELSEAKLALNPCVTKFRDSCAATISPLGFFTGHFLTERDHQGAFFKLRNGTAVVLVVGTTYVSGTDL
jgi:hypothetical protein